MEKLIAKGKKEIRLILEDSLHQTVQALGVTKSKKKTDRLISRSAKRIADLIADQVKKELKKFKSPKDKAPKATKAKKVKKVKKLKAAELETA
jgi:ribosomal protein S19E (S16A)